MERQVDADIGSNLTTQYLGPPNIPIAGLTSTPFYDDYAVEGGFAHKVDVAFGPVNEQKLDMDAWGVFPTLTFELGSGWQVRTLASYGESSTTNHVEAANAVTLLLGTQAGLLNPYDLEEASSALAAALAMPADEQRERMNAMRRLLAEFNVYRWAGKMLVDAARLRSHDRLEGRLAERDPGELVSSS